MTTAVTRNALRTAFHERYGEPGPAALVRAPGRVNLIGEHIDYNGLPVFPMAIPRWVSLLFRPRDDGMVRLATLEPGLAPREFGLAPDVPPYQAGDWGNYAKAAAQALVRLHGLSRGFDGLVSSTIPVAGGLSSSSALVIAIALALLHANDLVVDPIALAEEMARAERYTGTQSGGMDQAICLAARPGTATRVDFQPLRLAARPVPSGWQFVVASSLVRAEKSGGAQARYNERTRECAAALAAVTARLGLSGYGYRELLRSGSRDQLLATGDAVLADPVRRRFRHVITEAHRVTQAEDALMRADLIAFGRCLSASHASLRDDYEVSIPALDELVTIAQDAGASGARLTGAGMGGCAVAVVSGERLGTVLAALRQRFYLPHGVTDPEDRDYFVAEPSGGATVESL